MIVIDQKQFLKLVERAQSAQDVDLSPLLDSIGQTVADAAKARLIDSKKSPSGDKWDNWSEKYAKTRSAHHSLLRSDGNLADSIDHQIYSDHVVVGSNLIYSAVHQFGNPEQRIPARPYLSDSNFDDISERQEIESILSDFLKELI